MTDKLKPEVREKLQALQARYQQLLAMLPTDANDLSDLDERQLAAKLADIELIANEMASVNAAQLLILDRLDDYRGP